MFGEMTFINERFGHLDNQVAYRCGSLLFSHFEWYFLTLSVLVCMRI